MWSFFSPQKKSPRSVSRGKHLRKLRFDPLEERQLLTIDMSIADDSPGEAAGSAVLVVTLSEAPSSEVTVQFNTQEDSAVEPEDFTAGYGTLTFSTGQTTASITVALNNDTLDEDNESFNVVLFNANGADLVDDTGVVTISDNDSPPTISVNDPSRSEYTMNFGGEDDLVFTVSLSAASSKTVTVDWATANGTATTSASDYNSGSGSLTFDPGISIQTVTVVVLQDTAREADETFKVNLSSPTNASLGDGTGLGTIIDDDATRQTNPSPLVVGGGSAFYSGNVRASFVTPGGLALSYDSEHASERPIVVVETVQPQDSPIPDMIKAQLNFGGLNSTPVYYDTTGLAGGDPQRFSAYVDASSLVTGYHGWTLLLTEYHGSEISTRIFSGASAVINRTASPYGSCHPSGNDCRSLRINERSIWTSSLWWRGHQRSERCPMNCVPSISC